MLNPHGLPTIVDPTGATRVLGTLPSDGQFLAALPTWRQAGNPIIPEADWREYDLWPPEIQLKDQDGYGACNGHAAVLGLELDRWVAGYAHVPLSAWSVYAPLCGGVDRGSSISEALTFLLAHGAAPEADVPYGTIDPRRISAAAKADGLRYRMQAGSLLSTWQEIMSAVQLRQPINLSVHASPSFASLDAEGVPPAVRGPGNHAVTVAFGAKKSAKWGWLVKMPNSWGTRVGLKGFWWLAEAHIEAGANFEGYHIVAASEDPQDPDNPPDPV